MRLEMRSGSKDCSLFSGLAGDDGCVVLLQGGSLSERGRGGGRCLWQKFSLGKQLGADPMLLFGGGCRL
jgi:hypothetical protein